jgi:hypothetical protein
MRSQRAHLVDDHGDGCHVWHNRSEAPCRFAWILLDAEPVEIGGRKLGASWQHER